MTSFSQRHGYKPLNEAFQREAVSGELRTKLWNALKVAIWDDFNESLRDYDEKTKAISNLLRRLWFNFFNEDLDRLPSTFYGRYGEGGGYGYMKIFFAECQWFEVYDFLEVIAKDRSDLIDNKTRDWINSILEEHNAAYRFVKSEIVEITDQGEIQAIEAAIDEADMPVRTHIETALRMLSDKESPDYRNSVKESISAVESACRFVTGSKAATLGDALKRIQNLHPAMAGAFKQLYGYTNDASGIRHSLTDEPTITYADAKFMLVACSAFVSYLKMTATA